MGQADGYHLDVLNRLKEIRDKVRTEEGMNQLTQPSL